MSAGLAALVLGSALMTAPMPPARPDAPPAAEDAALRQLLDDVRRIRRSDRPAAGTETDATGNAAPAGTDAADGTEAGADASTPSAGTGAAQATSAAAEATAAEGTNAAADSAETTAPPGAPASTAQPGAAPLTAPAPVPRNATSPEPAPDTEPSAEAAPAEAPPPPEDPSAALPNDPASTTTAAAPADTAPDGAATADAEPPGPAAPRATAPPPEAPRVPDDPSEAATVVALPEAVTDEPHPQPDRTRPQMAPSAPLALPPSRVETPKQLVCRDPRLSGTAIPQIMHATWPCGIAEPVRINAISGIRLSTPVTLDCNTAGRLASWLTGVVGPAAGQHLKGEVAKVWVMGSYACRRRNNRPSGKLSEHARGRAVDIGGVWLGDGRQITLAEGWGKGAEGQFLKQIRQRACGLFHTVLGPGSDAYHDDHLHLDTSPRGGDPYCR